MVNRRIQLLNNKKFYAKGQCVLYVMSRDQRVQNNHALLEAQALARKINLPMAVLFALMPHSGYRARQHYEFMLEGLYQVEKDLSELDIPFIMLIGSPENVLQNAFNAYNPSAVFFDFSPLNGPRKLQKNLAEKAQFYCAVVDTHNIVPVWEASPKLEYGARTIRPKIHEKIGDYLSLPASVTKHSVMWPKPYKNLSELRSLVLDLLENVPSNGQKLSFASGEKAAQLALNEFVRKRLLGYEIHRNNPTLNGLSGLSPYLHFGQMSSLQVIMEVRAYVELHPEASESALTLIEEMVVRKELSDNFCYYNPLYKSLAGTPQWAQNTLAKHASDQREFLYSKEQFEQALTHDEAWNAAQKELVSTGKMHGYMRMYWAKKILEWSESPEIAVEILIYLNDFYSIDGGDPNGYVGILWSVAGVHDRPWGERAVYGTIRCMVYGGLKRKFDIETYINSQK